MRRWIRPVLGPEERDEHLLSRSRLAGPLSVSAHNSGMRRLFGLTGSIV